MTDKEIIKALECCKSLDVRTCKSCIFGFKNRHPNSNCINELCENALDLINRQQAELEEARIGVKSYKGKYESAVKTAKELQTLVDEKQAEIENITEKFNCQQTVYVDLSKIIKDKNAEIERLQRELETKNGLVLEIFENKSAFERVARVKAIKECLGKIEQMDVSESDDYIMVKKYKFDNLVKELTDKEIINYLNQHENKDLLIMAIWSHTEYKLEKITLGDVVDLINRQQATIETLRNCVEQHHIIRKDGKSPLSLLTAEIRAEAIKEFAERLKDEASEKVGIDEDFLYYDFDDEFKTFDSVADVIKFLSAVVIKEMAGEDK